MTVRSWRTAYYLTPYTVVNDSYTFFRFFPSFTKNFKLQRFSDLLSILEMVGEYLTHVIKIDTFDHTRPLTAPIDL